MAFMNSSFSFFLAWIFCSLQMRSTRTALSGASSVLALWSFCPWGKICTLSPLEASSDAYQPNRKKKNRYSTELVKHRKTKLDCVAAEQKTSPIHCLVRECFMMYWYMYMLLQLSHFVILFVPYTLLHTTIQQNEVQHNKKTPQHVHNKTTILSLWLQSNNAQHVSLNTSYMYRLQ